MIPTEISMQVGRDVLRVPWMGEPAGNSLAVSPAATVADGEVQALAGWDVTHLPTGKAMLGRPVCLACARTAAAALAALPIDFAAFGDKETAVAWRTKAPDELTDQLTRIEVTAKKCPAALTCKDPEVTSDDDWEDDQW